MNKFTARFSPEDEELLNDIPGTTKNDKVKKAIHFYKPANKQISDLEAQLHRLQDDYRNLKHAAQQKIDADSALIKLLNSKK